MVYGEDISHPFGSQEPNVKYKIDGGNPKMASNCITLCRCAERLPQEACEVVVSPTVGARVPRMSPMVYGEDISHRFGSHDSNVKYKIGGG